VIHSLRLSSLTELSLSQFRHILSRLIDEGWHPAVILSELEFATQAGISKESVIDRPIRTRRFLQQNSEGKTPYADVCFRERDIFYLVVLISHEIGRGDYSMMVGYRGLSDYPVDIGLLTFEEDGAAERLENFLQRSIGLRMICSKRSQDLIG
jgi:hypothetical protein